MDYILRTLEGLRNRICYSVILIIFVCLLMLGVVFYLIFESQSSYRANELRAYKNVTLPHCKRGKGPTPATVDVCAFWLGDKNGLKPNVEVFNLGLYAALHGIFYGKLLPPTACLTYQEFESKYTSQIVNKTLFPDTSPIFNFTCCCSQYHEYTKHGCYSGRLFEKWISDINTCIGELANEKSFKLNCSPDLCRFDHDRKRNVIEECFVGKVGSLAGCKPGFPYCFPDD